MTSRTKLCERCGRTFQRTGEMRYHGRGLCSRCYYREQADGKLNDHPTAIEREAVSGPDCECAAPIPQPIPLFQAVQCARCGKRLLSPIDGSLTDRDMTEAERRTADTLARKVRWMP